MPTGRPLKYIINSDYATLKNDSDTVTATISIPAGDSISAGGFKTYTQNVTVGSAGAPMEWQIAYSAGSQRWLSPFLQVVENTGAGNQYQGFVAVTRQSATTARLTVSYYNATGSSVSTKARTVTAYIRTFIPPFS